MSRESIQNIILDNIDRIIIEHLPYNEVEKVDYITDIMTLIYEDVHKKYACKIDKLHGHKKQIFMTYYLYSLYRLYNDKWDYKCINYVGTYYGDKIAQEIETKIFMLDYIFEIKNTIEKYDRQYKQTDNKNEKINRVFERDRKAMLDLFRYSLEHDIWQ